jgi:hypothetical protein
MGRACRNRVLGPYEFFLAFLDCESQLLADSVAKVVLHR